MERKPKQVHIFCDHFIPQHETTEVHNSRTIKGRCSFSMPSFFAINDFLIINPVSMDLLLDHIYLKKPSNTYIILC